ncbi:integrin alpha-M-like isoform X1 [Alosa sapidissima]|uniref:integrin alpha-M-like isoform X1 n=1 Tax=Alosa sapidissima TaxID=34773 RepID=UPI001C09AF54|nr:integrin alpha-M-like isoform X1 [Alosa sapidissima]
MSALMLTFAILSAGEMVLAFNIEPVTWKYMTQPGEGFGYKVIQHDATSLLVSAPVEEVSANRRGRVYNCRVSSCPAPPAKCSCTPLNIDGNTQHGVNMSLGLWMNKEEKTSRMPNPKAVVCGPTIPKECERLNLYGGMCFSISQSLTFSGPVPPTLRDCPVDTGLDIAFLLDGSGSVYSDDFRKMKEFVMNLIDKFINKNTQFAVAQYSVQCKIAINFKQFNQYKSWKTWKREVGRISQDGYKTYTAEAINKLMRELFVQSAGNRPKAKRVLLVITDGASNGHESLQGATNKAHRSNIICYAIGVGGYKKSELDMIASEPKAKHVFTVSDFNALDGLKATLEENIVAIEGTQTSGDSTHMEFAQEGFSAALVMDPKETYLMSAVGAFQWKGIYQEYYASGQNPVSQKIDQMEPESYMGYSMAVATGHGNRYVVLGAPRYKHRGQVVVHHKYRTQTMESEQIGSYFGAEVCVVDLDGDSNTDLILASAPMHTEGEREGKVFVYRLSYQYEYNTFYMFDSVQVTGVSLLGLEGQRGRFGSSLASLADLNGDGIRDVAVGAPLEDNGQGSVYIFNGGIGGINPTYSQRIAGLSVRSGLRFFGLTVAQSALDQSGDGLPDIAVGSKGAVLLLRSRPIVSIATSVTFKPSKIPKSIYDCMSPQLNEATVCFHMTKVTKDSLTGLKAKLNYTLSLDFVRQNVRALFTGKDRRENKEVTVSLQTCFEHSFFVQCSPEDVVNPVDVRVAFSFEGLPIPSAEQLTPKLSSSSPITKDEKLNFEIDCGEDNKCIDEIHINFNFSGSIIEVGIAQEISVAVSVENRRENSYDTRVFLSYPPGLSYRTFTKSQGRVECTSLDSTDGVTLGKTDCSINRPILRAGHKADFVVQYGIGESSHFGDRVTMRALASSDNDEHHSSSQLSKSLDIGVKYSIYVTLNSFKGTTNYINFTAGDNRLQKPVIQELEVTNQIRGLNLTVVVHVPVRLQGKDIWTNVDSLQIQGCSRGRERNPNIIDLKQTFKDNKEPDVNCSIAVCLEFRCNSYMMRDDQRHYSISGNVSSEWIEQTGLRSALFHLVSLATLEYDDSKYIFYSTDSSHQAPVSKIETLVEVYDKPDLTKEIIGGVVGGLILLALMTAGLTKSGFFKSQYQQKLEEAQGEEASPQEAAE